MKDRRVLVFLDACVLLAAVHSPSGGSALVIDVCRGNHFKAAITARVILEARVNISEKFGETELIRFYQLLAALEPEMIPAPTPEKLEQCALLVNRKDIHVLAAALECGAEYLVTLDRRHLLNPALQTRNLTLKIMTPGDFLKAIVERKI